MKYLVDTHAFMWCFEGSDKLSKKAKNIITDTSVLKYISIASVWEFAIKHSMGKFPFEGGILHLYKLIEQFDFIILNITQSHLNYVAELPFIHRDPFDRLLIAVAKAEGMTILTADENIHKYDVPSVW